MKTFILLFIVTSLFSNTLSFPKAKRIVKKIYQDHPYTLHCDYNFAQTKAKRIVWKYLIPAERFGRHLKCWHTGDTECRHCSGRFFKERTCCKKVDLIYKKMEADMHNIYPILAKKDSTCQKENKGAVARTYLYFHKHYQMPLSKQEINKYTKWHLENPSTPWEMKKNQRVLEIQGNSNFLINETTD